MTATARATIPIVDDEREAADAYAAQFSARYGTETAYSGEEVLETLRSDVDVVLLDRRMLEVAGQDV